MADDRLTRPDCELAHHFTAGVCGDPSCGLHLIPRRSNNVPICEMVVGRDQLREVMTYIFDNGLDL